MHDPQFSENTPADASQSTNAATSPWRDLFWNLKLAGLAIFQQSAPGRIRGSLFQLFIFCGLLWGLSALDDLIDVGMPAKFSVWGVAGDAALNYFWLLAVASIVLLLRKPNLFLTLAVGSAAVTVLVSTFWIPFVNGWRLYFPATYSAYSTPVWWCVFGLECAAFYRLLSWQNLFAPRRMIAATLVFAGISLSSIWYFPPQPMFYEPWDYEEAAETLDVEAVYYAQANLLQQALHKISNEEPGNVDIYSIGFAAYGEQDVFLREVQSALKIVAEKFNTHDKSIALINNPQTVNNEPLASSHNLQRSIRAIAGKMNLDEDMLLVFLSSHGSEDGSIAVQLDDMQLSTLDATMLRNFLDEAHVYWRIIIVSACYSGSFIDALKSPTSLIITAAAADKASFGCEHTRDWTYFGEGFFEQALPNSASMLAAFETAKEIISTRETEEGKERSEPQIWIGEAMKAYLALHAL
ncbi:MAG: C13 family peptidase [Pseudomonadota bacterium]